MIGDKQHTIKGYVCSPGSCLLASPQKKYGTISTDTALQKILRGKILPEICLEKNKEKIN